MQPNISQTNSNLIEQPQEGRWNQQEHIKFLQGIMLHGKDWKIVQKVVKSRTGSQVRSHAQKFFLKLHQISKQRNKAKNWNLIEPSDIQKEILKHCKEDQITQNTPQQITEIIKKDWNQLTQIFQNKKNQLKSIKKKLTKKQKSNYQKFNDKNEFQQNENSKNLSYQNEDESYFIKIIKKNKEHFFNGHNFEELIDFNQNNSIFSQQNLENSSVGEKRKRSFCLLDEQENETKLKQALTTLHCNMGFRQ